MTSTTVTVEVTPFSVVLMVSLLQDSLGLDAIESSIVVEIGDASRCCSNSRRDKPYGSESSGRNSTQNAGRILFYVLGFIEPFG